MKTLNPTKSMIGLLLLAFGLPNDDVVVGQQIATANLQVLQSTRQKEAQTRISLEDLPEPFASESVDKQPTVAGVPERPTLAVPKGFLVNVYADDISQARWLAMTPDGHVLCSCGRENKVYLLRDTDSDGVADQRHLFLDESGGANLPFGMDFAQIDGQWYFYLGNTDGVVRFPYQVGQDRIEHPPEKITELPGRGYNQHWTRNVRVAPDGKHLFATVGSQSNVDVEEPPRASVLRMQLDGSNRKVFASGLRNPVGLDFHPETEMPYVTVNERDKLGDNLVPDYLTGLKEGEFYGWPYAYLSPENIDPRRTENGQSEAPELARKTVSPDVLFQAHSAALGLTFCRGDSFPEPYRSGAFVAFRGSWNRDRGTGYKVVFVPFDDAGRPRGYYQDFLTGFLTEPEVPKTWGRPVSVMFHDDGSLLLTEEGNGRIYRVSYQPDASNVE